MISATTRAMRWSSSATPTSSSRARASRRHSCSRSFAFSHKPTRPRRRTSRPRVQTLYTGTCSCCSTRRSRFEWLLLAAAAARADLADHCDAAGSCRLCMEYRGLRQVPEHCQRAMQSSSVARHVRVCLPTMQGVRGAADLASHSYEHARVPALSPLRSLSNLSNARAAQRYASPPEREIGIGQPVCPSMCVQALSECASFAWSACANESSSVVVYLIDQRGTTFPSSQDALPCFERSLTTTPVLGMRDRLVIVRERERALLTREICIIMNRES